MPAAARGRPKGSGDKIWRDAVRRAVLRAGADKKGKQLELLADKLISCGLEGDVSALKEIGDRLDGKAAQAIVGDADADPVQHLHRIERVIVRPKA